MKTITIKFYNDPGHGWCKVKKSLLIKLNIADKISGYSYERNEYAYLEEDCDAALLINTLNDKGLSYKLLNMHTNKRSRIRNYNSYMG
jgi:hypothetical protein